jgi:hypothetical protein
METPITSEQRPKPRAQRIIAAFAIAPIVVPTVMLVYLRGLATSDFWFVVYVAVATVFAYFGAIVIGAPVLFAIWSRGHKTLWVTVVAGIAIAAFVWLLFGVLFSLSLGHSFPVPLVTHLTVQTFAASAGPSGCAVLLLLLFYG